MVLCLFESVHWCCWNNLKQHYAPFEEISKSLKTESPIWSFSSRTISKVMLQYLKMPNWFVGGGRFFGGNTKIPMFTETGTKRVITHDSWWVFYRKFSLTWKQCLVRSIKSISPRIASERPPTPRLAPTAKSVWSCNAALQHAARCRLLRTSLVQSAKCSSIQPKMCSYRTIL